jgi:hypothetical protein
VASIVACDKNSEDPSYATGPGQYQGGYGAQYQGGYGASYQGGAGATYGQGAAPQGGAAPQPQPTSNKATPIPPAMAAPAAPIIKATASRETQGMSEAGGPFAGQFQQGQVLEQPFQIEGNTCYTVVAVSPLGITELDVQIVVNNPPAPEFVAAQDNTTGPQAILGGGNNCWRNPFPVGGQAVVRMIATAGSGIAMAQVYKK